MTQVSNLFTVFHRTFSAISSLCEVQLKWTLLTLIIKMSQVYHYVQPHLSYKEKRNCEKLKTEASLSAQERQYIHQFHHQLCDAIFIFFIIVNYHFIQDIKFMRISDITI